MCKHRFPMCKRITNRDLSIYKFLFVSPGVKKRFIKGEAQHLLWINSSHLMFHKNMQSFKTRQRAEEYPNEFLEKHPFDINFKDRKRSLENKDNSTKKKILPFVTQYHLALPNHKNILMEKMAPYTKSTALERNFQEPPILSYRKGKSLKDSLVRAKLWRHRCSNRFRMAGVA